MSCYHKKGSCGKNLISGKYSTVQEKKDPDTLTHGSSSKFILSFDRTNLGTKLHLASIAQRIPVTLVIARVPTY